MAWVHLLRNHISASLSIEPDNLELSPFDKKGWLGGFFNAFGEQYKDVLKEMNAELVA